MLEAVIQAANDVLGGKEELRKGKVPDYPSALKARVFLSAPNPQLVPRGCYRLLPGAISQDAPTPGAEDRRSTKVEPFFRASVPFSAHRKWESMAQLGLHIGSTLDNMLGDLASLVKDSPQKALSSPEESKVLASALMHVLSEGIEHTTELFSRLQAHFLLARRDAGLASCTLAEQDHATLRALPSNSLELFARKLRPLFSGRRRSSKKPWCE